MLDFWHPVLRSQDLPRGRAVGVRVGGRALALFRPGPGQVGALDDKCSHRRMKLSLGTVRDGRLACPYHGWTFDCAGQGESPSTPKLYACVPSYDCREAEGAVWVKAAGTDRPLPEFDFDGFIPVGLVIHRIRAPLQLVIDNFSENEHTAVMHADFGFDPARSHEAVVRVEWTDRTVSVYNAGPAKRPPLFTRLIVRFRRRYHFRSDYTFHFDPPRSVVDHYWTEPDGSREAMMRYRLFHFFVPEDEGVSRVATFAGVRSRWPIGPGGGVRPFRWRMRRAVRTTLDEDVRLLENLADQNVEIEGMKLSRFDRVLSLTRERMRRIYYEDGAVAGTA
ncbi:MAG TPA: Rieske 2Fe-2S domain-containing protein [Gemmataceae bacterium]|nr:Rieske 2Fe-2S domain-containing protein [Gemmataceae bacterium]